MPEQAAARGGPPFPSSVPRLVEQGDYCASRGMDYLAAFWKELTPAEKQRIARSKPSTTPACSSTNGEASLSSAAMARKPCHMRPPGYLMHFELLLRPKTVPTYLSKELPSSSRQVLGRCHCTSKRIRVLIGYRIDQKRCRRWGCGTKVVDHALGEEMFAPELLQRVGPESRGGTSHACAQSSPRSVKP